MLSEREPQGTSSPGERSFFFPSSVIPAPLLQEIRGKKQGNVNVCTLSCFIHVQLFVTLWTIALEAPLSMGFLQARILE